MWTSVDYELDWPPDLLAGELRALFDHPYRGWTGSEVELLLTEAFHTGIPAADFTRLHSSAEWTNDPAPSRQWIADLFEHLPEMRPYAPPRPYWAARRASPAEVPARDPADVMYRFDGLVGLRHARGYLAGTSPSRASMSTPTSITHATTSSCASATTPTPATASSGHCSPRPGTPTPSTA